MTSRTNLKYLGRVIVHEVTLVFTRHHEYSETFVKEYARTKFYIKGCTPTFLSLDSAKAYVRKLNKRREK